jgi:NitT/TauT family transport system substrate-binding protein
MQVNVQPHTDYRCAQLKNHADASLAAPAPASKRYADQFWHAACSASVASYRNTTLCASRSAQVDPTPAHDKCERRGIMCDGHGSQGLTSLTKSTLDRRSLLKASALGTIVMGVSGGMMGLPGSAHAASTVKGTHGNGFCNVSFFITHARQLAKEDGLTLEFVNTPSFADQVTFLGTGQVDVSVLPYTNFMALYDAGAPVKIVAGGGVQGVSIVAQPGLETPAKLKGKTLGTFQNDTLEVLPYDWLKKNGVSYKDVTIRYMDSMGDMVAAFKAGSIDIASTIEPYGSALLSDVKGSVLLSDGIDVYGPEYTDCVLAASSTLLVKDPGSVKALIKAMLKAQLLWEQDRETLLTELVGTYYKTSLENARIGGKAQPAKVDQRAQTDFILNRVDSVMAMGYIKKKPGKDAIDWSHLEQAIAEVPDVYAKLKYKSA